jgi:excisionase family DNA binding protein
LLLTAKEVAARLRVCTATVYKLCASGALPHVRVLNAVRVVEGDLERFIFFRQA